MAARVLFILYLLEAGVFFILAPWTRFWVLSPVLHRVAMISFLIDNNFFRGFVSGFGLLHLFIGGRELARLLAERAAGRRIPK